jgi:O-succinylhomoserine sulfhydrylase
MEGAAGFAFASGMAAINYGCQRRSYRFVKQCFLGNHSLFVNYFGISKPYFDINNPDIIESCVKPNTKILFAESPTNPAVDIIDLELLLSKQ